MAVWNTITKSKIQNYRLDSEFYKKELTILDDKIEIIGSMKLGDIIDELTDYTANGSFASLKYNVTVSDNVNYAKWIRIQNLDSNDFINNIRYVPFKSYSFLKKSKLFGGELLVSKTGEYLGKAYLFMPNGTNENYTLADNIFLIRLKDLELNGYVFSFINSKLGRKLLLRWSQGTGQPTIIKDSLRSLKLPIINEETKKTFNTLIDEYYIKLKQSQTLYKEAEELLEKELGLDGLEFEKPRSYTAKLSEVYSHNRCDADFYQTKFRQIEEHINTLETLPLRKISMIQKGFEVGTNAYVDSGKLFIRVSNFTKNGFSQGGSDKYISDITYAKHIANKPNLGDILLTKDGTVGVCYVVDSDIDGIISSGIVKLLPIDETIPKEYLSLAINSKLCQMQIQRDCSGALIVHWKPEDIRNLKIPILSEETMNSLANMVTQSKQAFKQSKQLLEDAKAKVEALIEEASR